MLILRRGCRSPSTAHRIFIQFKETGNVTPIKQPDLESMCKLDEHHELLILIAVSSNPWFPFRGLLCAGCCEEMVSPTRRCSKWQSNDAQITGWHTWHTFYSFPKNAWYLLMKLVVLQKTRLEFPVIPEDTLYVKKTIDKFSQLVIAIP